MQTIYPTDMEGTKWFKLGQNLREAVTTAGITIPGDLKAIDSSDTEGTKWYKLGRWLSLLSGGGGGGGGGGVGFYTPTEILESRNIVNSDAAKWLYNSGGAKDLTFTGSGGGLTDLRFEDAIFDWPAAGIGSLGYWLPRVGGDLTGGLGDSLVTVGGTRYHLAAPDSFTNPDSSPSGFDLSYISVPTTQTFTFTLAESALMRIGMHFLGPDRTLIVTDGNGFTAQAVCTSDRDFVDNPALWKIVLPAGTYTLTFSTVGDNPGLNGLWWDPYTIVTEPGPLAIGDSLQGFQASPQPITLVPGGNTFIGPGLVTQGVGSWFEVKKIGDNLYHVHGDLA